MSRVVDVHESEYDEKMADIEAFEPQDSALGGLVEKVCTLSGSSTHVTEIAADILWG